MMRNYFLMGTPPMELSCGSAEGRSESAIFLFTILRITDQRSAARAFVLAYLASAGFTLRLWYRHSTHRAGEGWHGADYDQADYMLTESPSAPGAEFQSLHVQGLATAALVTVPQPPESPVHE